MNDRDSYTAGLRELARFLDAHPEVPLPYHGSGAGSSRLPAFPIYLVTGDQKEQLATIARAMGNATKEPKTHYDGTESFVIWREFGGVVLFAQADRDQVCRRVVTGVEDREVEEEVTPAVTRKVVKRVETFAWECLPLLDPDAPVQLAGDVTTCEDHQAAQTGEKSCKQCGASERDELFGPNGNCLNTGACGRRAQAAKAGEPS